jgi:RNA polymerase sigma-70 factor (ECF subfamily)
VALRVDDVDLVRDRALVERFQEGDSAAFDTLYSRYFARLTRFCQKRVGDPHEAEEIAQEAFTRALRALPTFEGERRFYPWMTVIASRLCVDTHRRRGRTEPTASVDLGVIEGGQEKIVDAVDLTLLADALGRLAPRHREVLDLREHHDWSYQRIADHYGVSLGTVEALLFRARKALRREFLAVVGVDRNWAGLPALGFLVRRLGSLKAKVDAVTTAVSPVAAAAVAMAVAVATVTAAIGAGGIFDRFGDSSARSRVSVVGVEASSQATHRADVALPDAPVLPSGPPGAQPAAASRTSGDVDDLVVGAVSSIEVQDGQSNRVNSDDQPIAGGVPALAGLPSAAHAGADPEAVLADTANKAVNYEESVKP